MSISTKKGDGGQTSLWSGERVAKDDLRVDAYGSLDELSSFLGLALHSCKLDGTKTAIVAIQKSLLRACGELASTDLRPNARITDADQSALTQAVAALEAHIPLRGFVVPGSTPGSAALDVARTVCRRTERRIVSLSREVAVGEALRSYMNRLSDYLYMLARSEEAAEGRITYA